MGRPIMIKTWLSAGILAVAGFGCAAEPVDSGDSTPTDVLGVPGAPAAGSPATGGPAAQPPQTGGPALDNPTTPPNNDVTVPVIGDPATANPPPAGGVPCDVNTIVQNSCQGCHGATPVGGANRLVELADWHKPAANQAYGAGLTVHEVAAARVADGSMPQGAVLPGEQKSALMTWLSGGAQAATAETAVCSNAPADPPSTERFSQCDLPGAFDPLVAQGEETCYDFPVHAPGNLNAPFVVNGGESYHEFYYDVPWNAGDVGTRFGANFDNEPVLHHYLTFTEPNSARRHGDVDVNVSGTTIGREATLISGWAVGGCTTAMPDDVGFDLIERGKIFIQWHMYNNTGLPQADASKVQICTVPRTSRPNVAGITFLGTELIGAGPLGMPPGPGEAYGSCTNVSGQDIKILGWTPHMHEIGVNMKTERFKVDGTSEVLFDEPFQFDYQINYMEETPIILKPGERLFTTCGYNNTSGVNVGFGQSTKSEMCYQFTISYPLGALNNGVPSLIGATNTCW